MEILKNYPNLWFTADWHHGHEFLIRYKKRPFATLEEMTETMVERHNAVVQPGDLVYNLGDGYLKLNLSTALAIQKRYKGNHYFIHGNHDNIAKNMAKKGAFVWFRSYEEIKVGQPWFDDKQKKMITLCHYAMRTWRNMGYGSWQLYGHSHSMLPEIPFNLAFDIGVDVPEWNFSPVSIEQVIQKMNAKMPAFLEWKERVRGQPWESSGFSVSEEEGDSQE
jgi:calcineurin-like phosphoesterase family protein